jgi:hypothetical protein
MMSGMSAIPAIAKKDIYTIDSPAFGTYSAAPDNGQRPGQHAQSDSIKGR